MLAQQTNLTFTERMDYPFAIKIIGRINYHCDRPNLARPIISFLWSVPYLWLFFQNRFSLFRKEESHKEIESVITKCETDCTFSPVIDAI